MTSNAKGRPSVTGQVLTFIFGPFLMLRVFGEFFSSIKNDAKVAYFLNKWPFWAKKRQKRNAGPWPKIN